MSDDDLPVLRQAMAGLAEHGGSTDLYDRTLRTSRRLARRRAIASGGAVAAAVLAIGVPVALAQRQQSPALPPATVPSVGATTAPTTPAPTATLSRTVTPTGTTPTRRETAHRPSSPRTSTSSRPAGTGCPVSAATLEKAADYPEGYRIKPADVRCSQGWATAALTAPSPDQQGDGLVIFKYSPGAGTWKKVGEGSDIRCADFGMPKSTGFCY
ncbi:hypothetical protein ACPCHT_33110 [Nucisporomicrobium flavum]|uniref:hypothetical protein n=1 Tax=Nucisporomicrobium flavum TaxID=2785915 RepID=UPI0018F3150C|nr:hypothetical protein [Nucisporomicrobium flavum]